MRMYLRYVERKNWSSEIMTLHDNEGGGIKEAIISIKGSGAYGNMKFESGVHAYSEFQKQNLVDDCILVLHCCCIA